jgi:hypothetical protein
MSALKGARNSSCAIFLFHPRRSATPVSNASCAERCTAARLVAIYQALVVSAFFFPESVSAIVLR